MITNCCECGNPIRTADLVRCAECDDTLHDQCSDRGLDGSTLCFECAYDEEYDEEYDQEDRR